MCFHLFFLDKFQDGFCFIPEPDGVISFKNFLAGLINSS